MKQRTLARGFTLTEVLTALLVVGVLAAIAVPMWRNHLLRVRRADAIAALIAVQTGEDRYFGRHARYATRAQLTSPEPDGLGLQSTSAHGYYRIELQAGADGLGYRAVARAQPLAGQEADARCVELSLDHVGRRRAVDDTGRDRSGDCWR